MNTSTDQKDWPTELPRFAESFRVFIQDPRSSTYRLLTGDWELAPGAWPKWHQDILPKLARAGVLGFIASTVPPRYHHDPAEYFGPDYPTIYWHWAGGRWVAQATEEMIAAYCKRRGVPRTIFDKPMGWTA